MSKVSPDCKIRNTDKKIVIGICEEKSVYSVGLRQFQSVNEVTITAAEDTEKIDDYRQCPRPEQALSLRESLQIVEENPQNIQETINQLPLNVLVTKKERIKRNTVSPNGNLLQ